MILPNLQSLSGADFRRLCADLLAAEEFVVEQPSPGGEAGRDLMVVEAYHSHSGRTTHLNWRVQFRPHVGPGQNFGESEAAEALATHDEASDRDVGLFVITDTDYDEAARSVFDQHASQHPGFKVTLWNQRQLATRLERHPHIAHHYGLFRAASDYLPLFSPLGELGAVRTLLISDQSALAHGLTSGLRAAGFDLSFLPFWNYADPRRLKLALDSILEDDFRLVVCFLGDSFSLALPEELVGVIKRCYQGGASLLLFPFLAWSMHRGLYASLRDVVPVRLLTPGLFSPESALDQVSGSYRRGDFRWLLSFDSFAEDQYNELDPGDARAPFAEGINSHFGLSHSFEYLAVERGAQLAWADTAGNPMVILREGSGGKVCYLNTCCHSCMTPTPISSPLEASPQVGLMVRNILRWLLT